MSGWNSLVKHFGRKVAGAGAPAVDTVLPLGARLGSLVSLPSGPFLRAADALVAPPAERELVVAASSLKGASDGTVHRLYLARGDSSQEAERFLQIYTPAQGRAELMYFSRLARIYPDDAAEQALYLGIDGRGLGDASFTLSQSDLADAGVPPSILAAVLAHLGGSDAVTYSRCLEPANAQHVPPLRGREVRADNREGSLGLRQEVHFMPYRRLLSSGDYETLLVSTEIQSERDGTMARQLHVDFMVGLDIAEHTISIA